MIDRWATPVWIDANGPSETLERVPVGQAPFAESDLRDLLARNSSLLPVGYFDPVFSSPVCLGTEFRIPGVGRIDAFFLSPSGYLTIVETKLWQNPEARREVVAQVIDYARRLARWTYGDLEVAFREHTPAGGAGLFDHVCNPDEGGHDQAEFCDAVNRCLSHGRFLLLVVGDGIREGLEQMSEFLQRTPTLQYTLGLVEMACYRRRSHERGLLVVPHIVARTAEVTRAVVRIDLQGRDTAGVDVTAEVPTETKQKRVSRANRMSEEEFYAHLAESTSPATASKLRTMIERLLSDNEALELDLTPNHLRVGFQPAEQDGIRRSVFLVSRDGIIRTGKRWVEYLAAKLPTPEVDSFVDGVAAVDERMRPKQRPDGTFSVSRGGNAADLQSIVGKLDMLATVVSAAVRAVEVVGT